MNPPDRSHRLNVPLSADEAGMLEASAHEDGASQSDVVRRLIRDDYASRGMRGAALEAQEAWQNFEREHRRTLSRDALASEMDMGERGTQALRKSLGKLELVAKTHRVPHLNIFAHWVGQYVIALNNRYSEVSRQTLDAAFKNLWDIIDQLIDRLKADGP